MKSKRFWLLVSLCLVLIFILFQYRFPVAKGVGGFLAKREPLEKSDLIFAPASRIETNFLYAVNLFSEGWGKRLVTTAPKLAPVTKEFQEAYGLANCSWISVLEQVWRREKLPLERLVILEDSLSSYTDCQLLHSYWKSHPFRSVIVVTDGPHARRFRITMDKVFGGSGVKILSCPSFPEKPLEEFFAEDEDYVMFVFEEYIKIAAYTMKYALQ